MKKNSRAFVNQLLICLLVTMTVSGSIGLTSNNSDAIRVLGFSVQSAESASAGSSFVTRRAGRKLAARLTHASVAATAAKTAPSRGST